MNLFESKKRAVVGTGTMKEGSKDEADWKRKRKAIYDKKYVTSADCSRAQRSRTRKNRHVVKEIKARPSWTAQSM